MAHQRISRSELYELVWTEPASQLAKRFAISDVMLGKVCAAAGIPKPGLGYWTKQKNGKLTKKISLPPRGFGQAEFLSLGQEQLTLGEKEERMLVDPIPPEPIFEEHIDAVTSRAQFLAARAPIKKSLSIPHPEIAKILRKDEQRRAKQDGSELSSMLYRAVSDSKQGRRRLTILNSLLQALSYCGAGAAHTKGNGEEWSIHIGSVVLGFELAATSDKEVRERNQYIHGESEEPLKLTLSWWQSPEEVKLEWIDKASDPLEQQIKDMVVGFLVAAERIYRAYEVREHELYLQKKHEIEDVKRRRKEALVQEERKRQQEESEERRQNLFAEAADFQRASEIRAYVHAKLSYAGNEISKAELVYLQSWAEWALSEADQIDPLKRKLRPVD